MRSIADGMSELLELLTPLAGFEIPCSQAPVQWFSPNKALQPTAAAVLVCQGFAASGSRGCLSLGVRPSGKATSLMLSLTRSNRCHHG